MENYASEALLEMHYHSALVKLFADFFGEQHLNLYKPTPNKEAWVGFDQAWTHSELSEDQLFNQLSEKVSKNGNELEKFYFGYFLQFKVVEKFVNRSSLTPAGYTTPYYRSKLSLKPNKTTGLSQHETLRRLHGIKNSFVYYACPMVLDPADIYKKPDLEKLRLVSLEHAPNNWKENERHRLHFQTMDDSSPLWCSDPIQGESIGYEMLIERNSNNIRELSLAELNELMYNTRDRILNQSDEEREVRPRSFDSEAPVVRSLPESFSIIEFGREKPHQEEMR